MKFVRSQRRGFTLIELLVVIAVISILAAIAIPNLLASRKSANEASAIGSLRTITSAEATYRSRAGNYDSLTVLGSTTAGSLIDGSLAAGAKSGYNFAATVAAATNTTTYYVTAAPITAGSSGDRYFYTDEGGVIYAGSAAVTAHATAGSAPTNYSQIGN